ncbi:ABC transporter permease [Vagococcus acidifermentans]|uniref:Peptide ABC transporter permease n=1 Tax=Vagococcus acidifermentans TaxID=564710 RepID=A0A430AWS9_9ENTE|nr:ABC transporter permease [Vagococcus acidifermentans]RSU12503.1 peptide ABC transporter permease [Vagococcus acidifermentans]
MTHADRHHLPEDSFERIDVSQSSEREKIAAPSLNFLQDSWRRLRKNKGAVVSLAVLSVIAVLAFGSIWLTPHDPTKQNISYVNLPPKIPGVSINGFNGTAKVGQQVVDKYAQAKVPADVHFFLGTDGLGRDVLSRLLMGTRSSLIIAFAAALLDVTIGLVYGLFSGLKGGRTDNIMQRILEVLSGVPNLVVMILFLTIFKPGMKTIILAMIVTGWITMARVVRAQTLKVKDQEFVLAAMTLGAPQWQIAVKHVLPNISSVVIVQMMFSIPSAIFFEAFLSFIGLGLTPPVSSLGIMLSEGYKTFRFLPHLMWVPAVTLSAVMICFNLLADGMRDAFDPKMKD